MTIVESYDVFWVNHQTPSILVPDDGIYTGCGVTKTCFGIPAYCVPHRSCAMVSAVTYNNPDFTFELLSTGKSCLLSLSRVGKRDFMLIVDKLFG